MLTDCVLEMSEVALLAEGVDRNALRQLAVIIVQASPSSRRAWIEIEICGDKTETYMVALLAEGVDRNAFTDALIGGDVQSPSSRRAWIEMASCQHLCRKLSRRPPRGGRG